MALDSPPGGHARGDARLCESGAGGVPPRRHPALCDDRERHNLVIGSTRYANIDLPNRRLEIGWTWITSAYQRTGVNTEAKLLLLTHAFETLRLNRVELKTDALNQKSRAAIARIGAMEEGTFRKHLVTSTGRVRDTVYFSIIDTEWPAVKARLLAYLRPRS
jgi:RimJ/RimL family protein N-acetyltransferase